jgi:hypothetical protein
VNLVDSENEHPSSRCTRSPQIDHLARDTLREEVLSPGSAERHPRWLDPIAFRQHAKPAAI